LLGGDIIDHRVNDIIQADDPKRQNFFENAVTISNHFVDGVLWNRHWIYHTFKYSLKDYLCLKFYVMWICNLFCNLSMVYKALAIYLNQRITG